MKEQAGNVIADLQELTLNDQPGSDYGQIFINNNVIAVIAHETAKKVPGVVELQGTLADDLAGIIGKRSKDKGIRVEKENDDLIAIDLAVVLEFGTRIPDICVKLQAEVKDAVEEMTGKHVSSVNVVVQGIRNLSEQKKTEE